MNDKYELKVLGIRHHGAGSCLRVVKALQEFKPDYICVEMPFEATALFPLLLNREIKFPIAFLFFSKLLKSKSLYLPVADFSPELQAILYALNNTIPVSAIDLPSELFFQVDSRSTKYEENLSDDEINMVRDPIGYLAKLDGYKDGERWWELNIEHDTDQVDLFDKIKQMMQYLREQSQYKDDEETLMREAWMKNELVKIIESGKRKIAIVCGAWHAPIFDQIESTSKKLFTDKKFKKLEIAQSLIPWSFQRMALSKYYTAGISSPVWHQFLFEDRTEAISKWLTHAAIIFRKQNYSINTAQIIDAEILTRNIAFLRNHTLPCIDDMLDAAVATFCEGKEELINLVKEKAIVGIQIGQVPLDNSSLPFQIIFFELLKVCKLDKYWKSSEDIIIDLDLRKDHHLKQSNFLHLCRLLNIDFGFVNAEVSSLGNFKESWRLHWQPELDHRIVELSLYGNSIEDVVEEYLKEILNSNSNMKDLASILNHLLKSKVNCRSELIVGKILESTSYESDLIILANTINPLYSITQFGSLFNYETQIIEDIISNIVPKCILVLQSTTKELDREYSKKLLTAIQILDNFIVSSKLYEKEWEICLYKLNDSRSNNTMVSGKIWQILLNRNVDLEDRFMAEINFIFESGEENNQVDWIEGFLSQHTQFFYFPKRLVLAIHSWLISLSEDSFRSVLVFLRRVFADISSIEKNKIYELLKVNKYENKSNDEILYLLAESRRTLINDII